MANVSYSKKIIMQLLKKNINILIINTPDLACVSYNAKS